MTNSDETESGVSPNSNIPNPDIRGKLRESREKAETVMYPISEAIKDFFYAILNRKPAYLVTRHGIEKHYFDFSDRGNLPFDRETYRDTQIFIGRWANPWYFDIEKITETYPDFTRENITKIEDIFSEKHVYPSQRWKILANQRVTDQMFLGMQMDAQQLKRLSYAQLGAIALLLFLLLTGGV